ncbi:hypothetical protein [Nitrosomonas aestuarii]|uniref:hypothetical protein n=1 Tax=Nitrosomonas aestuarii TaxID=52441 RepID=UPI000B885AF9|nr:hypothetical protein [Nitrosomonas aestuarii]
MASRILYALASVDSPDTMRAMLNFAAQHHTNLIIEFFRFGTANEAVMHLTGLYLTIPINFGALNN